MIIFDRDLAFRVWKNTSGQVYAIASDWRIRSLQVNYTRIIESSFNGKSFNNGAYYVCA
jgi:hypothetical protein